ncbi:acyl-CoA dehydrogenase family protein [Paraburkholderia sediminicola]|uniref:acyl-CoA dehydrogenase family protein n=1 Tax=Paraburkholderia sediminicola TaxID=458836 RepID=UPI0038BD043D
MPKFALSFNSIEVKNLGELEMEDSTIGTNVDQTKLRAELVAKAASLVPLLRSNAPKTEEMRRLPDDSIAAMEAAGMFRICAPKKFGGYEGDVRTYTDVVAEVGRGCGSSAWIAFISNAAAWIACHYPEDVQREIFEPNPDTRFIGVLAPTATASRVDGGYVINGKWGYASCSLHAHWALLTAQITQENGSKELGLVLMPMDKLSIEDTWYSVGVRGSGSNTVTAEEVFVPERRILLLSSLMAKNALGDPERSVPFRQAFAPVAVIMTSAPVLGMAKAALEMTRERIGAGGKRIAYSTYTDARQAPGMLLQLAEAASLIEAANTIVKNWCDRIVSAAFSLHEMSFEDRARMRSDLGLAARHCRDGVERLMSVQGASAFAESNPIQRVWRDIATATRHGLISPEVPLEIYGRALVGDFPLLSAFV